MLPNPATFTEPRQRHRYIRIRGPRRRLVDVLLSRSRITNLGFLLLVLFTFLSFLFNVQRYITSPTKTRVPHSILATHPQGGALQELNHLIIVPGHSIWKGSDPDSRLNEEDWVLEPYQRGGGRVATFFSHIAKGAQLALSDPNSLLVFSGGQTRLTSTTTEAESYMRLALQTDVFHLASSLKVFLRATTEDYALDSFQNLLFSIARFHEYTGRYPEQITVVGYEMKRHRFMELHRAAVRWPKHSFQYVGVDPEGGVKAHEGERMNGYLPYSTDTYGCHSYLLSKRRHRNPFRRFHPYYTSAPELQELLDWCPDTKTLIFDGILPWDS